MANKRVSPESLAGYAAADPEAWARAMQVYDQATDELHRYMTRGRGLQQVLDEVNAARDALLSLDAPDISAVVFKLNLTWDAPAPERRVELSPERARVLGDLRRLEWLLALGD